MVFVRAFSVLGGINDQTLQHMKTNQTLIIALLLALPLAYFAGCSTGSNTNTNLANGSTAQSADSPAGDSVNIATVINRIQLYHNWREVLPVHATYDSVTKMLSYPSKPVPEGVAKLIDQYGMPESIPIAGHGRLPVAYFIPKYDLEDMLTKFGNDVIGIRLYPALDLYNIFKVDDPNSTDSAAFLKVYGVPVNVYGRDTIPQSYGSNPTDVVGQFAYDLTTPCPNTCDDGSPLYTAATAQ